MNTYCLKILKIWLSGNILNLLWQYIVWLNFNNIFFIIIYWVLSETIEI